MNREEFLKILIKQKGYTIKSFATKIGIPYTTLLSMLNGSIGGAAVESVIKICEELGISVESLKDEDIAEPPQGYYNNPEAAQMAQELHDNPEYRVLFDATRKLKPESIKEIMKFIDYQKAREEGDIDE